MRKNCSPYPDRPGGVSECLSVPTGPSLLLVIQGNMTMTVSGLTYNIKKGVVIFVAAELKISFVCVDAQAIIMYRAYCDLQS